MIKGFVERVFERVRTATTEIERQVALKDEVRYTDARLYLVWDNARKLSALLHEYSTNRRVFPDGINTLAKIQSLYELVLQQWDEQGLRNGQVGTPRYTFIESALRRAQLLLSKTGKLE